MGKKVQFTIEDGVLKVEFKIGRRTIREEYPYIVDWKAELAEALAISALDVAIHYPEFYWAAKYQGKADELEVSLKREKY